MFCIRVYPGVAIIICNSIILERLFKRTKNKSYSEEISRDSQEKEPPSQANEEKVQNLKCLTLARPQSNAEPTLSHKVWCVGRKTQTQCRENRFSKKIRCPGCAFATFRYLVRALLFNTSHNIYLPWIMPVYFDDVSRIRIDVNMR